MTAEMVTPYSSVRAQRFKETCHLHLQSRRVNQARNQARIPLGLFSNFEYEGYMLLQNQQNPPLPPPLHTVFWLVFLFDPQFAVGMFLRKVRLSELRGVTTQHMVLLKIEQSGKGKTRKNVINTTYRKYHICWSK